jgi:hypothetical protein
MVAPATTYDVRGEEDSRSATANDGNKKTVVAAAAIEKVDDGDEERENANSLRPGLGLGGRAVCPNNRSTDDSPYHHAMLSSPPPGPSSPIVYRRAHGSCPTCRPLHHRRPHHACSHTNLEAELAELH